MSQPVPMQNQHEAVQKYYGETLQRTEDLKTNACCTSGAPDPILKAALRNVPDDVIARYYGCGSTVPIGIEGKAVLDLGCGTGRDVYVAAQYVGTNGSVVGVDMTPLQLDVGRANYDAFVAKNPTATKDIRFLEGKIEDLKTAGVADGTIDVAVSNCVINLCPDKECALSEVFRVLKNGGEFYFSDVYSDRRLPKEVTTHEVLVGECLGGALYINDFVRICRRVGFADPRVVKTDVITVSEGAKGGELKALLGNAKFYSITYRLFKLDGLEDACEDYGQVARYLGTLPHHRFAYALDDHHTFEKGRTALVCGNTAKMLSETWLAPHFKVDGDMSVHFGAFDCSGKTSSAEVSLDSEKPTSTCCAGGGCCLWLLKLLYVQIWWVFLLLFLFSLLFCFLQICV